MAAMPDFPSLHVREEPRKHQPPSGPGHDLLENWALWTRGGSPAGSCHEWSVRERLDTPHEDDIPEKVVITDRIVARIGVEYPVYRRILKHYYIGREHPWQIAGLLRYTEGFVWMSLRGAADLVGRRYEELTFVAT